MGRVFGVGGEVDVFLPKPKLAWRPPGFAVLIVLSALIGAVWMMWNARSTTANAATTSVSSTLRLR